jgi:hypothetical protein
MPAKPSVARSTILLDVVPRRSTPASRRRHGQPNDRARLRLNMPGGRVLPSSPIFLEQLLVQYFFGDSGLLFHINGGGRHDYSRFGATASSERSSAPAVGSALNRKRPAPPVCPITGHEPPSKDAVGFAKGESEVNESEGADDGARWSC